ncbi:hypothetical protein JZK55_07630 [Dissulfurispira thermophila]|uniref:Uncharacterized protein n=2 Tax=root TaxID=1 RepID=A0A7G1H164_9BACT|nr:hypothetical protein [Dissulfurispira thermophila]BCB95841.1 hypothetical protein JZK55_07630 [Dissulfurispira thermophila]
MKKQNTVLIVDDDEMVRKFLFDALKEIPNTQISKENVRKKTKLKNEYDSKKILASFDNSDAKSLKEIHMVFCCL